MKLDPPNPTSAAADIAVLTTGVAAVLMSRWVPEAGLLGLAASFAITKYVDKPIFVLREALRKKDLSHLTPEQAGEFVSMAYRFMEAAKQGEYEHTLKVLAAFITEETGQKIPNAGNFARTARRIESLSMRELQAIAHIAQYLGPPETWLGNASFDLKMLAVAVFGENALEERWPDVEALRIDLAELATRGIVIQNWQSAWGSSILRFEPAESLRDLLLKAGATVAEFRS